MNIENTDIEIASKASKRKLSPRNMAGLALALVLVLSSGCFQQGEYLEDFNAAFVADNYAQANDIFAEAEASGNYELQDFLVIVQYEIDAIVDSFQDERLSYDEANLALRNLRLGDDFEPFIRGEIETAISEISEVNHVQLSIERADMYLSVGEYEEAIDVYDGIIAAYPDDVEAKAARSAAVQAYTANTMTRASELVEAELPHSAIFVLDRNLEYDADNPELLSLKSQAEASIEARETEIQNIALDKAVAEVFATGNFTQIEDFIAELETLGIDTAEYESRLQTAIENYINTAVAEAQELASSLGSGHWGSNPYAEAITRLNQALQLFPNNENLLSLRNQYQSDVPENIAGSITETYGHVNSSATGTDADGYSYNPANFNRSIYLRPDSGFTINTGDKTNLRLLITPQTSSPSTYRNFNLTISINGETSYSATPFEESTSGRLFEYELPANSVVQVSISQSGFASFFERILGTNGIYIEGFRY